MSERPDYYKLLHVQPDAPEEVIKASYRTMMQRLGMHPDLGGDHTVAVLINEAFETLSDPWRRAEYDRAIAEAATAAGAHADSSAASTGSHRSSGPDWPVDPPLCSFCRTVCKPAQPGDPEAVCVHCGAALFPAQRVMPDDTSRRAMDRLPRHMPLTFVPGTARRRVRRGITLDLSPAGMRFITDLHLPTDERLLIECGFCSAVGVVRSVRHMPDDQHEWEIGVQFITMRVKRQRGSLIWTVA